MDLENSIPRKPLRLWPGVLAATLQWLAWLVLPAVVPEWAVFGVIGAAVFGLVIVVWWLFFSRALWPERLGAIVLMVVAVAATSRIVHESIANGMMGMMLPIYSIPVLSLALVAWAVASRGLSIGLRRASMVAAIVIACGTLTVIRTGGISGEGDSDIHWRWTPTPEERLLAQAGDEPVASPSALAAATQPEKSAEPIAPAPAPAKTPEKQAEAKADEEPVAAAADPIPAQRTAEWPGFRGPERDSVIRGVRIETDWSRTPPVELWRRPIGPGWSSFVVIDDAVIAAVSGRLVAYDIATGDRRWLGPSGGSGYSSPHLLTIDGVPQILLLRGSRTISVAPADGTLLWEHTWQVGVGFVQPALAPDGDVLISVGDAMGGMGVRRIAVTHGPGGWSVEERWTSRALKPYFNDFVVHEGHAFGFDGSILASIDLENGERKWKGGRYGHGQMVVLPDQDLLLVLSEEGELALVRATPDQFTELARFPAIEGKTWNHPVLVGDVLLVRNGEEMAAFRLSLAGR